MLWPPIEDRASHVFQRNNLLLETSQMFNGLFIPFADGVVDYIAAFLIVDNLTRAFLKDFKKFH